MNLNIQMVPTRQAFILVGCCLLTTVVFGQQEAEIKIKEGFFGTSYYQGRDELSWRDIDIITIRHPEVNQKVQRASTLAMVGNISGAVGGFLLGWQFGRYLGYKMAERRSLRPLVPFEPGYEMIAVGGGLTLASIIMARISSLNLREAARAYNSNVSAAKEETGMLSRCSLQFTGTAVSMRIALH